jgi:hypothetical protein
MHGGLELPLVEKAAAIRAQKYSKVQLRLHRKKTQRKAQRAHQENIDKIAELEAEVHMLSTLPAIQKPLGSKTMHIKPAHKVSYDTHGSALYYAEKKKPRRKKYAHERGEEMDLPDVLRGSAGKNKEVRAFMKNIIEERGGKVNMRNRSSFPARSGEKFSNSLVTFDRLDSLGGDAGPGWQS